MLELNRAIGEKIVIGDDTYLTLVDINKYGQAVLGIEAPCEISVDRKEIYIKKKRVNRPAPVIKYKKRKYLKGLLPVHSPVGE